MWRWKIRKSKYLIIILGAILTGIFFSDLIINNYQEELVIKSENNVYLLQYGAYQEESVMEENAKNLSNYIMITSDNKYYIYLGIYTNYSNALKVKKILEEEGISIYLKTEYLNNSELISKINILDKKIGDIEKKEDILNINKEILELFKKENNGKN